LSLFANSNFRHALPILPEFSKKKIPILPKKMLTKASCIVVKCCNKSNCNSYIPANVKFVPPIGHNTYQYINQQKDHNLKKMHLL
jgi:hypothetical protein